ncbi:tandem-95 repeat protein, partial [bacterium]|nr:tandem-95 repeat protein [bacterium]
MLTGSWKPNSVLKNSKWTNARGRSSPLVFALFIFLLSLQNACSSNAKVQVQALDRTAMQDKINTIEGGTEASKNYKDLTAKLNEDERDALNLLLARVIDRSPSKADKKATVASLLTSIESVRKETSLQGKVKNAIDSLLIISSIFDASLRSFSDALQFAPADSKMSYLTLAEDISKRSTSDTKLMNAFESGLPSLGGEIVFRSATGWSKIPTESALAVEFVASLLKVSSATQSRDLEGFLERANDSKIQSKILEGLRSVSISDAQLANIVKVQNIIPEESLSRFNELVSVYTNASTPSALKTSTIEALKKVLVTRAPLLPQYIKDLQAISSQTDSSILMNGLVDSIDKTTGEAYFSQPKFTTKSISPYTVPGCILPGSSTTRVTYSFKWTRNGSTLLDWTQQSYDRNASAGSLFALNDTAQCFVRVFVDSSKVAELNSELITVRSMPPIFTSGEPPQPQAFTAPKNVGFVYKVADRDPISDTGVFYKIVGLPQHGVVSQTEVGTFDYKPLPSYVGSDSFKFMACNLDDMCSSEKVINLSIVDGNQPPRLDRIIAPAQNTIAGGIKMSSDSTLNNIQLIIDDDDVVGSSCGIPNVIVTSGNPGKFPQSTSNIEVSGTFPFCKLKLSPAAGSTGLGVTTLTIKLDDGTNPQVTSTVDVTVLDKTPQWSTPATPTTFTINKNSGANTLYLNAATDADAGLFITPQTLTYVFDSNPAAGVGSLSGASNVPASGNGSVVFTPTTGTSTTSDQSTTFTYKVCDSATPQNCSTSKTVTINVVNNAPTISAISNPPAISEDSNTGPISFTIADIDDSISCSNVGKSSSNTNLIPVANVVVGGSGTSCTATVTPVANGNGGPVAITLSLPHKTATVERTFLVSVNALNDAPALSATGATLGTTNTPEDTSVSIVLQSGIDVDTDPVLNASPQSLRYELVTAPAHGTLSTGNSLGVMSGVSTTSILTRTVTYSPATNFNGSDQFTYKICDSFSATSCTSNVNVLLNVTAVNDAPTMSEISYQVANENSPTSTLAFTIGDVDNTVQCSQVVATSSNTSLVPNSTTNLAIGGNTTESCSITVTPLANQNGSTIVTLTLNDSSGAGNAQVTKSFAVTFMPVNDPPTIAITTSNQTINEDNSTSALPFTIGDDDNTVQCSQVTASSSNSTLIPNTPINLTIGGTAPNCTITVTPAANQNSASPATITLSLNDGSSASNSTVTSTFTVTVNADNDPPTLTDIIYQIINEGNPTSALAFTIADVDNTVQCSQLTATSDNPTLVPNSPANLAIGGAASQSCTITVTPAANQNGFATVTLSLNDGSGAANATTTKTFAVSVVQVNNAPTLSTIANQTINEDSSTSALAFTIGDIDNTVQCSQVTASSSNSTLIPNTPVNLAIAGTAPNCTITVTPAANQNSASPATITLSLNDGSSASNSTVTSTFTVTVNAVNDAPTISAIPNQTINEDSNTGALEFTIDDVDNASLNCNSVTASSSLTSLVESNSMALAIAGGTAKTCTITVSPLANQNSTVAGGPSTITLSLSDGVETTTRTFTVTVLSINDAPTLLRFPKGALSAELPAFERREGIDVL